MSNNNILAPAIERDACRRECNLQPICQVSPMRIVLFSIAVLCSNSITVFGSDIREFDLRTVERLGAELAGVSQSADRGATNAVRKRAKETAIRALQGKLFNAHYDYDSDGSGFLVYALASARNKIVLGGHLRVTVSADGSKAEQIDTLSRSLLFASSPPKGFTGEKPLTVSMSQTVSNKPLETSIYSSLHDKVIVSVGTMDGGVWCFVGEKVFKMTPELMKELGIDEHKAMKN